MANIPSNDIEYLRRKIGRLELLVLALFTSETWDSDKQLTDEFLHMFHRYYERDRDRPRDPEFFFLLERLMRRGPSEQRHRFDERLVTLEKRNTETVSAVERLQARGEEQFATFRASIGVSVDDIASKVSAAQEAHSELKQDVHGFLVLQSMGLDISEVPLPRFVPIRVYLSEADPKRTRSVSNAMHHLLDTFGFVISDDFPEESGSWWKKWFAKTKDAATQPEVIERLKKIERAVELQGLHKPQSEINKNEAEAAAALIKAVENVPTAAIQAGAILLVKTNNPHSGPCIQVRTLTLRELTHLEKNQKLLASPQDILVKLTELNQHEDDVALLPSPSASA